MNSSRSPLVCSQFEHNNTVAHLIVEALRRHGVQTFFGQSLPSLICLAAEQAGIRQVAYRTENAGGYMADAHARISRLASVVTAQNGPAATLLVPPFAEAMKASVPIVALVQDVDRSHSDRNAFQELDHVELFRPVTKWVRRVTDASSIERYVDHAFVMANSGRPGPVALILPADLLAEPAPPAARHASLGEYPLDRTVVASDAIKAAAERIAHARRPIVIAGGGVHASDASGSLAKLQEIAHLPVATTLMGKGSVDERHPLSIGVVGYFMGPNGATRHHRPLVADADVVLLVGTRTNQNATDSWALYPRDATYIHIDEDPLEIGRNYESLRLLGDARSTLNALITELQQRNLRPRREARESVERMIALGRAKHLDETASLRTSAATPIRPERLMTEIARFVDDESIIVTDASYSSIWAGNYLTSLRAGMRFLTPRGLAGLGWGFPMALGAKLAHPEGNIFCVVGDGGFAHVWSELETAVREQIKITCVVINNGILGYQKHAENVKFGAHTSAVSFAPVDHAAIARACGCQGVRVEHPDELASALEAARNASETTLIDVICDERAYPPITSFSTGAKEAS